MTIEKKIEDLIASIDANTAALITLAGKQPDSPAEPEKTVKPVKAVSKVKAQPEPVKEEVQKISLESQVEKAIESMLKANKRKEAIALLASFNGAKSKTSIIEQGEDVMAAFLEGTEAILLGS
jgi:hypothetical protein